MRFDYRFKMFNHFVFSRPQTCLQSTYQILIEMTHGLSFTRGYLSDQSIDAKKKPTTTTWTTRTNNSNNNDDDVGKQQQQQPEQNNVLINQWYWQNLEHEGALTKRPKKHQKYILVADQIRTVGKELPNCISIRLQVVDHYKWQKCSGLV